MHKIAISLIVIACLLAACSRAPLSGTAITNVTVIDAVNGVRQNQTVVFDGDRIRAIRPASETTSEETIVDGSGKYLIPGLWDFHVHLTYDDRFTDSMPEMLLSYGITSVRDTGGLMHKVLPVVERMRAADAMAPRVFFAGPLLDGEYVVYDGDSRPEIGTRNATPEDARATIASLHEQGVDFIKIYELVSPAVFAAMVEAAKSYGLPIDSHVPLSMRASTAGPSVDSIEHLRNIEMDCASDAAALHETRLERLRNPDNLSGYELRSSLHNLQRLPAITSYDQARCDETIKALARTTQVPTLRLIGLDLVTPWSREGWEDALARSPEAVRNDWRDTAESSEAESSSDDEALLEFPHWAMFLVERMNSEGIPIAAGTDTPIGIAVPGFSLHAELAMLVRAGLSPIEALAAATLRPAQWFSLEAELGTIDVGKQADLLLLDADPLEDIVNTRRINLVVSKGRAYSQAELIEAVRAAQTN